MAKKLPKQFMDYRSPKLLYIDAKTIDPERLLTSFFMRLDNNGRNVTMRNSKEVGKERLMENIKNVSHSGKLVGFVGDKVSEDAVWRWLESDLLITITQGKRTGQVAAPRPLHLSSYKLRNRDQARDYNTSEQLYTMIKNADPRRDQEPNLEQELRSYLAAEGTASPLDIGSLMVMLMAEPEYTPPTGTITYEQPALPLQAAKLCDDLWRLLAYRGVMARQALIEMMRTLLTIHSGLYVMRLMDALPRWMRSGSKEGEGEVRMLVDLGEDAKSPMASLARASYGEYIRKIPDYVRETFAFNQLLGYWKVNHRTEPEPSAKEIIGLLASEFNTEPFKAYFTSDLYRFLLPAMVDDDGRQDKMAEDIIKTERHPFNQLVEIISYARLGFHFEYATQLVGSTLMRNTDFGLIRSGRARWASAQPRFAMGSRLLETLVLLALLDGEPGSYHTRPCTIDYLVDWLAERYGIYINPLQAGVTSGDAYPACRANLETLKGRLRSIGYYADLSDASNAQTINPRYRID